MPPPENARPTVSIRMATPRAVLEDIGKLVASRVGLDLDQDRELARDPPTRLRYRAMASRNRSSSLAAKTRAELSGPSTLDYRAPQQ